MDITNVLAALLVIVEMP